MDPGYINKAHQVYTTGNAFAVLHQDQSVTAYGAAAYGGDTSVLFGQSTLTNVHTVASTTFSFAAVHSDATVTSWGKPDSGGNSSSVQSALVSVQKVLGNKAAFTGLTSTGTVVVWGLDSSGGVDPGLSQIVDVYAHPLGEFFVAKDTSNSLHAWGNNVFGNAFPSPPSVVDADEVVCNVLAAAIRYTNGSVSVWGFGSKTGYTDTPARLHESFVRQVFSTALSFAALHNDGSVTAFGDGSSQSSLIPTSVTSPLASSLVFSLSSTSTGFVALHSDGAATAWGQNAQDVAVYASGQASFFITSAYGSSVVKGDLTVQCFGETLRGGACPGLVNVVDGVGKENAIFYIVSPAEATQTPTSSPLSPTMVPSSSPSLSPSLSPFLSPSFSPTLNPATTQNPISTPSSTPSLSPSSTPSLSPSLTPSLSPTSYPVYDNSTLTCIDSALLSQDCSSKVLLCQADVSCNTGLMMLKASVQSLDDVEAFRTRSIGQLVQCVADQCGLILNSDAEDVAMSKGISVVLVLGLLLVWIGMN